MSTTTTTATNSADLRTLSEVANALSWSSELQQQHPALAAELYRLIEAYGTEIEQIAQEWGNDEF